MLCFLLFRHLFVCNVVTFAVDPCNKFGSASSFDGQLKVFLFLVFWWTRGLSQNGVGVTREVICVAVRGVRLHSGAASTNSCNLRFTAHCPPHGVHTRVVFANGLSLMRLLRVTVWNSSFAVRRVVQWHSTRDCEAMHEWLSHDNAWHLPALLPSPRQTSRMRTKMPWRWPTADQVASVMSRFLQNRATVPPQEWATLRSGELSFNHSTSRCNAHDTGWHDECVSQKTSRDKCFPKEVARRHAKEWRVAPHRGGQARTTLAGQ